MSDCNHWTSVQVVLEYIAPSFASGKDEAIDEVIELVHSDLSGAGVVRGWVVNAVSAELDEEIGQWRVTVGVDIRQCRDESDAELAVRKSHQYVYDVMARNFSSVDSISDVGGGSLVDCD